MSAMRLPQLVFRAALYFQTIKNLRANQCVYLVRRRMLPAWKAHPVLHKPRIRRGVGIGDFIERNACWDGAGFRFLNQTRKFPVGQVDWECKDVSKLWRYNLHYFDYLHDKNCTAENRRVLLDDWIVRNPPGSADAWEAYTVSLRIVNWIKLFLRSGDHGSIPDTWIRSLYQQASWLEQNIEYHILANHYLKNAKALFFSGMFFEGQDAERWLKLGLSILLRESDEQILSDGGHFERSPMYHCIVVEDYLDVLNIIQSSSCGVSSSELEQLRLKTISALDFLNDICMPDGEIPLFNDSAFGIAPDSQSIFNYAYHIVRYCRKRLGGALTVCEKSVTGYYVIRHQDNMLIADCGPVGPDYQPGHAHCDTLSFELSVHGRRIIVDSGVHDYEAGSDREYARSTRAHNTVVVDGKEQSQVWGVFRVGRHARPLTPCVRKIGFTQAEFRGAHNGYLGRKVIHQRIIRYEADNGWEVLDEFQGRGKHLVENFLHVHPDYSAVRDDGAIALIDKQRRVVLTVRARGRVMTDIGKGWYYPEFGVKLQNDVIIFSAVMELPDSMCYELIADKTHS